ncbi:unnamed protein product [Parajaminaea phylloscopi]
MAPPSYKRARARTSEGGGDHEGRDGSVNAGAHASAASPSMSVASETPESSRRTKQWMMGSMADYLDPSTSRSGAGDESPDWELAVELRDLAELRRDAVAQVSQMSVTQRADLSAYDARLVERLVRRYVSFLNDALPVFHETDLVELVESVRRNADVVAPSRKCLAHLVIALGFATLARAQHRSSELARCAKLHWTVAQTAVPSVMQRADVAKLQVILLLLQYTLLFPESGNSWELSGSALRLAAALSLYREAREGPSLSASAIGLRRKLFWTAYCLDVSLSVALARPTAICDSWITTKPPRASGPSDEGVETVHPSVLEHIKLRRIQSSIYHHLYAYDDEADVTEDERQSGRRTAPSSPTARDQPHDHWFQTSLAELTSWKSHFKQATPFITAQWTELNFQITRTLMFRPSPRVPFPSVSALMEALDSSSKTIKLYKLNHRTSRINFPWLATHHVFMAGLTYLHSLKSLHDLMIPTGVSLVDVTMHVQSCASLLEALNTIQDDEDTHKVRDAFDAAAYAVLNNLFAARTNETAAAAATAATATTAAATPSGTSLFASAGPGSPNASVSVPAGLPWRARTVGGSEKSSSSRLDDLATSAVMALPSTTGEGAGADGVANRPPLSISGMLNGLDASTPSRSVSFAPDSTGTPSAAAAGAAATASTSATTPAGGPFPPTATAATTDDANDFAFLDWFLHPIDTRGDFIAPIGPPGFPGMPGQLGIGGGFGAMGIANTGPGGAGGPSGSGGTPFGNNLAAGPGPGPLFWDEKALDWM